MIVKRVRIDLTEDDGCNSDWLEVEEREIGMFFVVDENMTDKEGDWIYQCTDLGFDSWDDEVQDLDGRSDIAQCFGMSECLRWHDVELTDGVSSSVVRASS